MTCVEKRKIFFWVVVCSLGGESWDEEEEGEIGEERVGRVVIYSLLPMESPTDSFCRWFCQQFWRWIDHVIVRRSRFESLGNSIGKIACKKFHVSEPFFFFILNIPSVISSVYTDRSISLVYTDWITDGTVSVGNYHRNLPTELFCR